MTILPGQPLATPDAPPPPAPNAQHGRHEPPRPDHGIGSRALTIGLAGVVALAAAGSWYAVHHTHGGATAAVGSSTSPVVIHRQVVPARSLRLPVPHSRAAAMSVATKVFTVLPAQLPGWKVVGAPTFHVADAASTDPVSRAAARCVAGASSPGVAVDSPDVFHRTATPTLMSVSAELGFVRSPARAAADLAIVGKAAARQCLARAIVGRTVAMGPGSTLQFTSMKPVRVPRHTVGLEFDGVIRSNVVGDQAVRVVLLFAVDRATEITVTSSGLGAALPLDTDLRVLNALTAQTHRVIA
ncbi:MAG: hypothetical protein QOD07_1539 [Frankiaceae bacterium]|jgi:hypothetical protein|nr:hypothetical protein [Frankiaceae bacterium]